MTFAKDRDDFRTNDPKEFERVFGRSLYLWIDLKKFLRRTFKDVTEEWKFFSEGSACVIKFVQGKRILFYITPGNHQFETAFSFGNKAVEAILKSDLPQEYIDKLISAKQFLGGRGLKINVKSNKQLVVVKKLITVKILLKTQG